jgi:hypothetical protein
MKQLIDGEWVDIGETDPLPPRHNLKRHDGPSYIVQPGDTTEKLLMAGVDIFAFTEGPICNGPECVACGMAKCHHHDHEWWLGDCEKA